MKVFDFLGKFLGKVKIGSSETIAIEVPEQIYFREAAIYTAASLIANAISLSEFRVFSNNRPVINECDQQNDPESGGCTGRGNQWRTALRGKFQHPAVTSGAWKSV